MADNNQDINQLLKVRREKLAGCRSREMIPLPSQSMM